MFLKRIRRKLKNAFGVEKEITRPDQRYKELVGRFNDDAGNAIVTEALKLYCRTDDEMLALEALRLIHETSRF